MNTINEVIPDCEPCKYHLGETTPAYAIAMPGNGRGSSKWFYMCKDHFRSNGCRIGRYGQELCCETSNQ